MLDSFQYSKASLPSLPSNNNNDLIELHGAQHVRVSEGTRQVVFTRQGHQCLVHRNYRPKLRHSRGFRATRWVNTRICNRNVSIHDECRRKNFVEEEEEKKEKYSSPHLNERATHWEWLSLRDVSRTRFHCSEGEEEIRWKNGRCKKDSNEFVTTRKWTYQNRRER